LWRRDFNGANGLLSVEFVAPITSAAADRLIDSLSLFGIGASWGGFESLALTYPSIPGWHGGALVRLHIGLEDPADLIADLAQGFRVAFG
jgi:cystathionine beta-lyase